MRRMSPASARRWSALSMADLPPRSRKSFGVQTRTDLSCLMRSRMLRLRLRFAPRCGDVVCPIFVCIFRTVPLAWPVRRTCTFFGQTQSTTRAYEAEQLRGSETRRGSSRGHLTCTDRPTGRTASIRQRPFRRTGAISTSGAHLVALLRAHSAPSALAGPLSAVLSAGGPSLICFPE